MEVNGEMLNIIDIVFICIVVFGLVNGFITGFIRQAASLGGLILAILGARYLSPIFEKLLRSWFSVSESLYSPLAYLIAFLLILFGCRLIALFLQKMAKWAMLGGVNRILGMVFGALKYILLLSVLVNVYELADPGFIVIPRKYKENSRLYEPVKTVVRKVFSFVPESFKFDFIKREGVENKLI